MVREGEGQRLCRQSVPVSTMMFAKLFSRYFVNPRQSKKIYCVSNSQFLQIFSENKQCLKFKISRDSWIAASCEPQKLPKRLERVFLGKNQKMREKYFSA